MGKSVLVVLSVAGAIALSARAEAVKVPLARDVKDPRSSFPVRPFGNVVADGGGERLVIDTTGTRTVWFGAFKTSEAWFEPGRQYEISFGLKFLEVPDGSYLLLLMRPLDATNEKRDCAFEEVYPWTVPADGRVRFRVKIPATGNVRQAFQIHSFMQVKAEVSDLRVEELSRAFLPADRDATIGRRREKPLPTGSEAFEVEQPRTGSPKAHVYNVREFGVTTGSPDNSEALQAALGKVRHTGPVRLVFDKGVYRFGDGAQLVIDSMEDLEIEGGGSTFLFRKTGGKHFTVGHSNRVAFRNVTIDWDWEADPLASRVTVLRKGDDDSWAELRFDDYKAFPRRDVRVADVRKVERDNDFMPPGGAYQLSFEFHKGQGEVPKTEWTAPNVLRLTSRAGRFQPLAAGDRLLMRHYVYDMNAFNVVNDRHLTFENVHLVSVPGMGILVSGITEYLKISGCSVHPAKGSGRPIGATADAIHFVMSCGHVLIEDTLLGGGGDDTLNVHDASAFGTPLASNSLMMRNIRFQPGNYFWKGNEIEFMESDFAPSGFRAKIVETKRVDPAKGKWEYVFDRDLPKPKAGGFVLFNRRYGTKNVIVRHCTFERFPRGILLMADNVTIEDNDFDLGMAAAVKVETGYTMKVWSEGNGASNVVIRRNRIHAANTMGRYDYEGRPDIYISSYRVTDPSMVKSAYPVLNNILIEDNRFDAVTGSPVFMASAGDVTIRRNVFDMRGVSPRPEATRGAIAAVSASGIVIEGNTWLLPAEGAVAGFSYEKSSVGDVSIRGNKVVPAGR